MRPLRVLAAGVGVTVAMLGAVGIGVARYAVLGGPVRFLRVMGRPAPDVIRLPRIDASVQPATFGLEAVDGSLTVVGAAVAVAAGSVDRRVEPAATLKAGDRVRLVGNVFDRESALVRAASQRSWTASAVAHRVWDIESEGDDGGLRFVHVHGLGASPAATLRSVDAVRQLGYPSTVVSLDGNSDMFARVRGIRASAAERVTAAVDHARGRGARRVILVGWSFGGELAVQAAAGRDDVVGLILISATTDLLATIRAEAKARHLPSIVAELAVTVLTTPGLSRLACADRPLEHRGQQAAGSLRMLVMHSRGDKTLSREAIAMHGFGDSAAMTEFPRAPHTMEWNADPLFFEGSVEGWIDGSLRLHADG